ncbi:MAG TPA: aminoglycoside phosphotransferase family protein [Rhizomicrobium sp.]|nr:aminoglycoside phosphotransferase family protein [Rhizomicrobium sp.]
MSAREPKPRWDEVPAALRAQIAEIVGEPIAGGGIAWGGYGPTASFVLTTASGAKHFCKGTHPGNTPEGHKAVLRERANLQRFPELQRFGAAFRGLVEGEGWHLMLLEAVARAQAVPPWTPQTVARTIALITEFHAATPLHAQDALKDIVIANLLGRHNWHSLAESAARDRFVALFEDQGAAQAWLDAHLETLIASTARVAACGGPRGWIHGDIRSDNLIFAEGGRLVLVDWPLLSYGPQLLNIAFFLPSLEGEGGPRCADALKLYEEAASIHFSNDDIALTVAAVAGFFAARAGEPEMAALPRLRWIQKLQLFPALRWLAQSADIAPPPLPRDFTA